MSEIESIVLKTIDLAKEMRHEYVTIEHLAITILDDVSIRAMCYEVHADCVGIQESLGDYLKNDCAELVSADADIEIQPNKTHMLERVFNRALTQALFQGKSAINQVDLLLSILTESSSAASMFSTQLGLDKNTVTEWLHSVRVDNTYDPEDYLTETEREELQQYGPSSERIQIGNGASQRNNKDGYAERAAWDVLSQFTENMNVESQDYDDVVGRREELRDLVQTLARKKKSNAILVGPSGVGKTAIVQGLAKLVTEGNVPDSMANQRVLSLDMGKLVAGTKYRGDFEERMKKLVEALEVVDDVVLFIDEIHMVIGAGSTGSGQMDAGNMIKPALSGGKLKVIGATTDEEYRKIFEKEAALARRFTKIQVNEPSVNEAKDILRNAALTYELHYGVTIDVEAIDLAVDLSNEYIFNKQLPDKAFDVVDRTCAYNKIMPAEEQVTVITAEDVRGEVSRFVGIPAEHLGTESETQTIKKHSEVEYYLNSTVFGQDQAIRRVSDSITISLAGLKDPVKPIATYLFTGPTGVGKTELAKRLAESMTMKLVRYDMAEYQESHTVSKLIGSPPGYVGHGDGKAGDGLLITQLEDNPNCVLLLDEVEKASPDIMTVLLSLMDEGTITSSTGKVVSAKNAIIIMTSNLGAREGATKSIGFGEAAYNHRAVDAAIKKFFAPEFINRLDGIIKFNELRPEFMAKIVTKFLGQVENYIEGRKVTLHWDPRLKDYLAKEGYDPAMGARPLARLINEKVKLPLAKFIMSEEVGKEIYIDFDGTDVTVTSRPKIEAPVTEPVND
ncbi:ATP-dependent Clp protease ATP-binding subunit [bacterium]|nr:ATP-dependent Clp protease ATP-binding subunit [bacterium]